MIVPNSTRTDATAFGLNVWTTAEFDSASAALGSAPRIMGVFADFVHDPDFPNVRAAQAAARGATLMISWEPWDSWTASTDQPAYSPARIAAGNFDPLITRWAQQARDFGQPVLIRYAPEQNGDWRPWSLGVAGVTAADYIAAWRHVVGIFRSVGAGNVAFIWNPYVEVGGSTPMSASFPGADWIDYIGFDGYNWGSTRPWGWQSYDDIFASSVALAKQLAPGKPWLLAEIGCAPGAAKAQWIADTLSRAHADRASAVVWFEFNKETDWRLAADPTLAATTVSVVGGTDWLMHY